MAEIEIRALRKAFDGAEVLKGVDLTIQDGEFISLVGPSGCGKSTLLRIIAGLEPQSSGEIWIDGASADGVRPSARNLAMVFQSYALYPHLAVFDNIAVPLRMSAGCCRAGVAPSTSSARMLRASPSSSKLRRC
jgi:multiple sugar transport system ATP-binding protein